MPLSSSEQEKVVSVIIITDSMNNASHICTDQTINLQRMGVLSLLGFGERKKKVLNFLAKDAMIIDIRMPEEFDQGNITGSMNMVLDELDERLDEIKDFSKPILFCCSSGLRSDEAVVILKKAGLEAINAGSYNRLKKIIDDI